MKKWEKKLKNIKKLSNFIEICKKDLKKIYKFNIFQKKPKNTRKN